MPLFHDVTVWEWSHSSATTASTDAVCQGMFWFNNTTANSICSHSVFFLPSLFSSCILSFLMIAMPSPLPYRYSVKRGALSVYNMDVRTRDTRKNKCLFFVIVVNQNGVYFGPNSRKNKCLFFVIVREFTYVICHLYNFKGLSCCEYSISLTKLFVLQVLCSNPNLQNMRCLAIHTIHFTSIIFPHFF